MEHFFKGVPSHGESQPCIPPPLQGNKCFQSVNAFLFSPISIFFYFGFPYQPFYFLLCPTTFLFSPFFFFNFFFSQKNIGESRIGPAS